MAPANQKHIFNDSSRPNDVQTGVQCRCGQHSYQPTYQLKSKNPVNFDQIQRIIRESVRQQIDELMPIYEPAKVMKFIRNISSDVKLRVLNQHFDRSRTVVIANVTEKAHQAINWQVGTLFNSESDGWTSFEYETSTYMVNVFVACVYWD